MAFIRCIGPWTMTALVINGIVGGGIFGFPGELSRLLGRASPVAMIVGALGMAIITACVVEVASRFNDPGGPYLYARAAFGRFAGIQVGWFHLLTTVGATAALASLFVDYLGTFVTWTSDAWMRSLALAVLIAIPAAANYRGARAGANLSSAITIAKLAPLLLLIVFGARHFARDPVAIGLADVTDPGWNNWAAALVFLVFAFGGWEAALVPAGEIKNPRRTIAFGAATGLLVCSVMYALLQYTTVATIGTEATPHPLADVASVLLGARGAAFVAVAAMISTGGWISGYMLNIPRLVYSLAAEGDFPAIFARLHPRFHTPAVALVFYASAAWALASSGSFLWIAGVSAGGMIVYYGASCAALMRLRRVRPQTPARTIPFGPALSIVSVGMCLALTTGLRARQLLLLGGIAVVAALNWLWATRHAARHPSVIEIAVR